MVLQVYGHQKNESRYKNKNCSDDQAKGKYRTVTAIEDKRKEVTKGEAAAKGDSLAINQNWGK